MFLSMINFVIEWTSFIYLARKTYILIPWFGTLMQRFLKFSEKAVKKINLMVSFFVVEISDLPCYWYLFMILLVYFQQEQ